MGALRSMSTQFGAWRYEGGVSTLPEVYRTLRVPDATGFFRKALAFAGPGFLVAVGYMDPGNWATDLAAGSAYGYNLLSVILLSNLMAVMLQSLCIKLGVATGRDLAQACRDHFSRPVSFALWVMCEVAIAACDLAEVIGSALALQLRCGIPLIWGVCLTALDVLLVLYLQNRGFRYIEALVIALIAVIGICFGLEILFCRPELAGITRGFLLPSATIVTDPRALYIAIGILGATVMPHNLYLHSSIVQTRAYARTPAGKREAIRYSQIDSTVALTIAIVVTMAWGESGTARLLILSQVVLSMQLSFAVFPLAMFTGDRRKMGEFTNSAWVKALAWAVAVLIAGLNAWLLLEVVRDWLG